MDPTGVVVKSDIEARQVLDGLRRREQPLVELGLLGGDLAKTVGARGDLQRLHSEDATRLPIDLGSVLIEAKQYWFVSHLVARNSWWHGPVLAVMNAQWIGKWDVAPRSHPNDGLFDIFEGDLAMGDRLKARSRLLTGTHVPHPSIAQQRTKAAHFEFDRPTKIWLDGEPIAKARHISVHIEPDAFTCVV